MFLDPQHSFQTRGLKYFFFKPSRASAHLLTVTTPWETAAFALIELLPVTALTQNLCGEFKKTEKGRSGSPRFAFFFLRDSSQQQQPLIQDLNSVFLCNDLKKNHEISVFVLCFFGGCFLPQTGGLLLLLSQQVFFENSPPPLRVNAIHRLSSEIFCSVVYCMRFYLHTDEFVLMFRGVLACGVFFVSCVSGCVCCENVL